MPIMSCTVYFLNYESGAFLACYKCMWWLGSRVGLVSMLDSGAEGPGLKSQSLCCWVTVIGKLFTPIVPLFTKQQNRQQPS